MYSERTRDRSNLLARRRAPYGLGKKRRPIRTLASSSSKGAKSAAKFQSDPFLTAHPALESWIGTSFHLLIDPFLTGFGSVFGVLRSNRKTDEPALRQLLAVDKPRLPGNECVNWPYR